MKNRKKGFTIVELVIVIAVIAILSAVLIPTFVGLTNRANETKAQLDMRNAYTEYASDVDGAELKAMNEVYLTLDNTTIYAYNDESGKWETVEGTVDGTTLTVDAHDYAKVTVEVDGETVVAFNGYTMYA